MNGRQAAETRVTVLGVTCANLPEDLLAARREVAALLGPEQLQRAEQAASLWLEGPHNGGLKSGLQSFKDLQQLEDQRRGARRQPKEQPEFLSAD